MRRQRCRETPHGVCFPHLFFLACHPVVGGDVAHADLGEVVEHGIGEGTATVEVFGKQHRDEPGDTPAVGCDVFREGNGLPCPPRTCHVLQLDGLQQRVGQRGEAHEICSRET